MGDLSVERSIMHHFAALQNPRSLTQRRHLLSKMLVMAVAATLNGADGWVGVATFAKAKEAWLRTFLTLPHGIRSHDCFGRVFALIDPQQFAACFRQWSASVAELVPDEIVAVDGKRLRLSHDRDKGLAASHLVSAWATTYRVVLGQVSIETRYFVGSIGTSAARFAHAMRGHWGIENGLHWNLDISFREDECRVRQPVARENLAVLRHLALSRLKNDDIKVWLQNKRLKAACNEDYLAKLLFEWPKTEKSAEASGKVNISKA